MESCLTQDYSEIIVVDDGSTDDTADIIKKYPVKHIYQDNSGPAAARNTGWRAASGEIVCFTDSDCIPEEEWVEKIVARYTSDDIGGVGGSYDIRNKESLLAECIHEEILQRHRRIPFETDFLGSFNVSYRRKVLEEVGGFDNSFRNASGEDNDLSYRVRKAGYKLIFDKSIKVGHYHQTKLFKYLKEQYRHGYWRIMLYRFHPDMMKGDSYAGMLDFVQPPLAMVIVGILMISLFYKPLSYAAFVLVLLLLVLQLPVTLRGIIRNRRYSYLYLSFISFLRAFARGFGMIKGIWKFFILEIVKNGDKQKYTNHCPRV
jgi:glycosyltransferase involved in cell wall biosynthesis